MTATSDHTIQFIRERYSALFSALDLAAHFTGSLPAAKAVLRQLVRAGPIHSLNNNRYSLEAPATASAPQDVKPAIAPISCADHALSERIQLLEAQKAALTEQVREYRGQAGQLQRTLDLTDQMMTETRSLAADRETELGLHLGQARAAAQYQTERADGLDVKLKTAEAERDAAYTLLEGLANGATLTLHMGTAAKADREGRVRLPSGSIVSVSERQAPQAAPAPTSEAASSQPQQPTQHTSAQPVAVPAKQTSTRPRAAAPTTPKPIRPQRAETLADLDARIAPERALAPVRESERVVPLRDPKTVEPHEEVKAAIVRALREQGRPMSESMLRHRLVCPRKLLGAGVFEVSCKALMAEGQLFREGKDTGRFFLPEGGAQ